MSRTPATRIFAVSRLFQLGCALFLASFARVQAEIPICNTDSCRQISNIIRRNAELDVDPCQDFYQYACGTWLRRHPTPRGYTRYSNLASEVFKVKEQLLELIQEPETPGDGWAVRQAKKQYRTCIDDYKLKVTGLKPLLNIIQANGGWPMITPGEFHYSKSWQAVQDEYNRLTGDGPLYTIHVYSSNLGSDYNAITLDQPWEFLPSTINPAHQTRVARYRHFIADVAEKFAQASGVTNIPKSKLLRDATNVFEFMQNLQEIRNKEEWRKRGPNMTISAAERLIKAGNHDAAFDLMLGIRRAFRGIESVRLSPYEVINVRELDYFRNLLKLIKNTHPLIILNYMQFHFVEQYIVHTTAEMRTLVQRAHNTIPVNRTLLCASMRNLEKALARMYVKRYVTEEKRAAVTGLLTELRDVIRTEIRRTRFLDRQTRDKALAKINELNVIIGYHQLFATDEGVDKIYSDYNIGDNLVQNIINFHTAQYRQQLAELRVPIVHEYVRARSVVSPTETLAFYRMQENRLEIPGALMHPPMFAEDLAPLANYAGLGTMITTLLSDLYILFGLVTNEVGHIEKWVQPKALAVFEQRTKCFVDQYNKMTLKELDDVGIYFNTSQHAFNPMLANYHFALKVAYEAHRQSVKKGIAYRLPGLEALNIDKQFFLYFANMHCETVNPESFYRYLQKKTTTTGRVKVNSAVANLPQFASTFNCPAGTPMNPRSRCTWFD